MTEQMQTMRAILDKIRQYRRIIITRHVRPDGDAIGSTKGLARILRLSFPDKEIYLQTEDGSDYLAFLGPDGEQIAPELYDDALVIVIDYRRQDIQRQLRARKGACKNRPPHRHKALRRFVLDRGLA